MREIFLELTGICTHIFLFSAECKRLFSSCADSERDAATARTGGNLRGGHARSSSPAIERGEPFASREDSHGSDGFSKNFRPGPSSLLFRFTAKGRRDAPKSPRVKSQHAPRYIFAVASLARRRSARTLGRAARLIEGPTKPFAKTTLERESVLRTQRKRLP